MRRQPFAFVLVLLLACFTLPDLATAAPAPHAAAAHARKPGKKAKRARPDKVKLAKPKPGKKKNDPGFPL